MKRISVFLFIISLVPVACKKEKNAFDCMLQMESAHCLFVQHHGIPIPYATVFVKPEHLFFQNRYYAL